MNDWKTIDSAPKNEEDPIKLILYQPNGFHSIEPRKGKHAWVGFRPSRRNENGQIIKWPHHETTSTGSWHGDQWGGWWVGECYDSEQLFPSHWMNLPGPPKE